MSNDELKDLLRSLTARERSAVLGLLDKYRATADERVTAMTKQRTRENREQLNRHINYWEHVASGFRWVAGVARQIMNPESASYGKARSAGIQSSGSTDSQRSSKTGRKVRGRSTAVQRAAGGISE